MMFDDLLNYLYLVTANKQSVVNHLPAPRMTAQLRALDFWLKKKKGDAVRFN